MRPLPVFRAVKGALPFAGVLIEFCWMFPWVLLLSGVFYGRTAALLLGPWTVLALMALGFITVRWALARLWSISTVRTVVVGIGFMAGLGAVKLTYYPQFSIRDPQWIMDLLRAAHDALPAITPPVMGALAATLLWWRGIVLGEREFSHFEIERTYRRGVAWSIVFVVLYAVYGGSRGFALAQAAPLYLLAFFSLGLTALAIARLIGIWQETLADEEQALTMNRHWLMLLIGVVGLILAFAMALSGVVSVEFRPVLLRVFRPLEPVLEFVFYIIFAVAIVLARIILLVWSRLPLRGDRGGRPTATLPPSFSDLFKDLPPEVVSGARWGMVLGIIALLVLLVAIAVVRARRRQKKRDEDERESVWSSEALLTGLGAMWRSLFGRFRATPRVYEDPEMGAIRALYRELLRTGASLGIRRLAYETPHEYEPRLAERLPGNSDDIAALTGIYVQVRYAGHQAAEADVRSGQEQLDRIRSSVILSTQ